MAYMIVIDRDSLQKLNHETAEIRLRTLEQISSKLKRALAHNEKVNVKPNELCKQLIRWFGIRFDLKSHHNLLSSLLLCFVF